MLFSSLFGRFQLWLQRSFLKASSRSSRAFATRASSASRSARRAASLPASASSIFRPSAGAALPESGLDKLADGLKKLISWLLCGAVTAFTLYLSVSGVLTGSADRAAVKAAQTAVSGAVPVVGSILAESAEMVLSAAHSLRAAIGAAGVLGVLLACLAPLVRLSVQFLLYRAAAFVSAVSGVKPLERLLGQLGDAFALVLGMTAACAALLLAALLVSISMVVM